MRTLLITDLDNTLYNWVDFYAESFRAMVEVLASEEALGIPAESIIEQCRSVFAKHGSVEYAFLVQELEATSEKSREELWRLVSLAKTVFGEARKKHMVPFPGTRETLDSLSSHGVVIATLTNAPLFQATRRLHQLGLSGYISYLAAWRGIDVPERHIWEKNIALKQREGAYGHFIRETLALEGFELKPSRLGYQKILSGLGDKFDRVYVLGDSLSKDLLPAASEGLTTIWARYGTMAREENLALLLRVTHWTDGRVREVYEERRFHPDFTVDRIEELLEIVLE